MEKDILTSLMKAPAEMFIYKEISNEGVNGAYFAEELRWLVENGAKTVQNKT
jgi:hypothetical protein